MSVETKALGPNSSTLSLRAIYVHLFSIGSLQLFNFLLSGSKIRCKVFRILDENGAAGIPFKFEIPAGFSF